MENLDSGNDIYQRDQQPSYRVLNFSRRLVAPYIFSGRILYSYQHQHSLQTLNNNTAIQLYRSYRQMVNSNSNNNNNYNNEESIHQSNMEDSLSSLSEISEEQCRICRYPQISEDLISCPCKCSGSVGFVHLNCLKRWIRFRRDNRCEICRDIYNIPNEPRNYWKLFFNFFQPKYCGAIIRYTLNIAAVTPLIYFSINQVMHIMDFMNEETAFNLFVIGPAILLATSKTYIIVRITPSQYNLTMQNCSIRIFTFIMKCSFKFLASLYFFLYFDWAISCIMKIQRILTYWWLFGDQDDDEIEVLSFDEIEFIEFPF